MNQEDVSVGKYGEMGLIQSKEKYSERKFTDIKNLKPELENQTVWLRGRLHTSRAKGMILHHVLFTYLLDQNMYIFLQVNSVLLF